MLEWPRRSISRRAFSRGQRDDRFHQVDAPTHIEGQVE
jgi:hypothetical protein